MKYHTILEIKYKPLLVKKCLDPELHLLEGSRVRVKTKASKSALVFEFESDDSTSLRAAINTVLKALQVLEKVETLK